MVLCEWILRQRTSKPDLELEYAGSNSYFTIRVSYGGIFTKPPGRRYIDGLVSYFDFVDTDLFSVHDINDMVLELGYQKEQTLYYHYCIPELSLDYGLMPLGNDQDVHKLVTYVPKHRQISVYIEAGQTRVFTHLRSPSKLIIEDLEEGNVSEELNRRPFKTVGGSCSKQLDFNEDNCLLTSIVPYSQQSQVIQVEEDAQDVPLQSNIQPVDNETLLECFSILDAYDADINAENAIEDQGGAEVNGAEVNGLGAEVNGEGAEVNGEGAEEDEGGDVENAEEDEGGDDEDEDEDEDDDDDFNIDDANLYYDVIVDMSEFRAAVDFDENGILEGQTTTASEHIIDEEVEVVDTDGAQVGGFENEDRNTVLRELSKSRKCSHGEVHQKAFRVGQTFKSKEDISRFIKIHSVETRREIKLAKNDKIRMRVKCEGKVGQSGESSGGPSTRSKGKSKVDSSKKESCPWAVQISRPSESEYWMVKTINAEHKCLQSRDVKACTYKFLADNIVQQIQGNPRIPVKALHEELTRKFELGLSKQKVARAKSMAERLISGDYQLQYGVLRDYVLELQNSNPGTTVRIDVYPEGNPSATTRTFRRIYVCLGALKLGFQAGLRDFLGVDGTFLKGPYPGQVLTAVGLDSNNGIFPVAYAIVEAENTSSWTWFLELLGECLDLGPQSNFTFISDRQKGIVQAISKVFPSAEHRFCLRHIQENFRIHWKDIELREQVWKCGRATTINHFKTAMTELQQMNERAHNWLSQIPACHWSKSEFTGRAHTDCLLNNLCEVFNSKLEDGRDKPIITCLEYIRHYLMKRLCVVQQKIDKCQGLLTPTATQLLEDIKKEASKFTATYNGAGKYQVNCPWQDQFVVNLNERTCTCRYWEITGLPCKHAVCAIWDKIQNGEDTPDVEEWVHHCYRMSTWRAMYLHKIDPINGRSMWPKSECPFALNPPKHHKQVGRPKKKRKLAVDELSTQTSKLTRKYLTVTCAKCHNKGHNSRTCKGQGGIGASSSVGAKGKSKGKGKGV
ncbi:hypothetical protein L1887_27221 [Cichorium endivia]|nr:hypothetical protein L1887_27221 [Cichorium endivia]